LPHEMETPAKRLEVFLKGLFEEFKKTPLPIPAGIALSAVVYGLVLLYAGTFCLAGLITPLFMLVIMWQFGIKGVKKLLIVGIVACIAFAGVWVVYFADYYQHIEQKIAASEDATLADGMVTPLFGESSTHFNYTLTINLPSANASVEEVSVATASVAFPTAEANNYTMMKDLAKSNATVWYYYYNTTVSKPINQYLFWAKVNGSWYIADEKKADGTELAINGPVYKSTAEVIAPLVPISFIQSFVGVYPLYALLLLMIWWTRRARKMRVEAYEKAVEERAREKDGIPQERAKVPSLAEAMGKETSGEGFVCSECGADVPADAKRCPKCGERFD
jgi:ribosomal protein L40E